MVHASSCDKNLGLEARRGRKTSNSHQGKVIIEVNGN